MHKYLVTYKNMMYEWYLITLAEFDIVLEIRSFLPGSDSTLAYAVQLCVVLGMVHDTEQRYKKPCQVTAHI